MPELILKLKDRELKRITINKSVFTIGRDEDNDLTIDNIGISRYHTKIEYRGNEFYVVDNGSSNGTFLNGTQIDSHPIKNDDEIQLGKYKIIFSSVGEIHDFTPALDTTPAPTPNKKKSRNVFGTLQFSTEELENVMKSSEKSSPSNIPIPLRLKEDKEEEKDSSSKTLVIALGAIIVILLIVLIIVIAMK